MWFRWFVVLIITCTFAACNGDSKKLEVHPAPAAPNREAELLNRIEKLEQRVAAEEKQRVAMEKQEQSNIGRNLDLIWRQLDARPIPVNEATANADPELKKLWPLIVKKMPITTKRWTRLDPNFGPASFARENYGEIIVAEEYRWKEDEDSHGFDNLQDLKTMDGIIFSDDQGKYISLNGGDDCPVFSLVDLRHRVYKAFNRCLGAGSPTAVEGFWLDDQVFIAYRLSETQSEENRYQIDIEKWDFSRNRVDGWVGPSASASDFQMLH